MKCPQCGHQNAKHYKFCLECGAEIPSVSIEPPKREVPKRVGIADAFESVPIRNPSPATLIRQVEDLSSDIGIGTPMTTPPVVGIKEELVKPIKPIVQKVDSPVMSSSSSNQLLQAHSNQSEGFALKSRPKEREGAAGIEFHTNLSGGRDSLASFEGEFFGELDRHRSKAEVLKKQSIEVEEESTPPPVPAEEQSISDPALVPAVEIEPQPQVDHISDSTTTIKPLECTSCGAEIPKDFLFCGRCGTKVSETPKPIDQIPNLVVEEAPSMGVSLTPPVSEPSPTSAPADESMVAIPSSTPTPEPKQALIQLIHIHLDGNEGDSFDIYHSEHTLGRDHDWAVFKSDDYLSNRHAQLSYDDHGGVTLTDLGGVNGVFLRLTRPAPLSHGDYFRAGQQLFAFERLADTASVDNEGTKLLGSPTYEAWGRLIHVVGQGEVGRAWMLYNEQMILGRVKGDIIFDQDRFMSGRHCMVSTSQGEASITDQGSTNGSFIRIRGSVKLEDEDLILLGQKIFKVRFENS
jgi:pSer/pThr/pTyr-binding forkhead associated (FHA) protein